MKNKEKNNFKNKNSFEKYKKKNSYNFKKNKNSFEEYNKNNSSYEKKESKNFFNTYKKNKKRNFFNEYNNRDSSFLKKNNSSYFKKIEEKEDKKSKKIGNQNHYLYKNKKLKKGVFLKKPKMNEIMYPFFLNMKLINEYLKKK